MQESFGIFRTGEPMERGRAKLEELRERIRLAHLADKSKAFNTARVDALELDNLLEIAEATAYAALGRTESRGAHARDDFPDRDDEQWLCHSMYYPSDHRVGKRAVNFAPTQIEAFEPAVREY